jgi:uncharacterized membrane protein
VDALSRLGNTRMLPAMQFSPTRQVTTAFAFAYPLVAHLAVARSSAKLTIAAIALLALSALLRSLVQGRLMAWLAIPPVIVACWWLLRSSLHMLPLYLPPVLVPAFLAWVFGQTLLTGRTPLIEQWVHMLHAPDAVPERAAIVYARRLTVVWTVLFVVLASSNLLLAALAEPDGLLLASGYTPPVTVPQEWWSLFANLIAYVIVVAFFAVEYAYRRRRFPRQPYRNMLEFVQRLLATVPGLFGRAPR